MAQRRVNFDNGKNQTAFVLPTRSNYVVNQKAPTFADRRTKRDRDRSSQNRNAIQRSSNDL